MARFRYVAPKRTSMDKIRGLLKAFEFEILVLAFMALFYFFSMYLLYVSARNDGRALPDGVAGILCVKRAVARTATL